MRIIIAATIITMVIHKSHPLAYHTSRILEDDIAKFKNLKINTSNDSSLNDIDIDSIIIDKGEL